MPKEFVQKELDMASKLRLATTMLNNLSAKTINDSMKIDILKAIYKKEKNIEVEVDTQREDVFVVALESSNVAGCMFDTKRGLFYIVFNSRGTGDRYYQYKTTPSQALRFFTGLLEAESKGKYVNDVIKGKYSGIEYEWVNRG